MQRKAVSAIFAVFITIIAKYIKKSNESTMNTSKVHRRINICELAKNAFSTASCVNFSCHSQMPWHTQSPNLKPYEFTGFEVLVLHRITAKALGQLPENFAIESQGIKI